MTAEPFDDGKKAFVETSQPNYCCECKHCDYRDAVREMGTIYHCALFNRHEVDSQFVSKFITIQMACGAARAYLAGRPNCIDPVPVCPKWEAA